MPDLNALLRARSVAIVGASPRKDSFGWFALRQLLDFGYRGAIYPVNPGYSEIEGLTCYPSLSTLPERVDCAAMCVADGRLEDALHQVATAKMPAAVIYGSAAGTATTGVPLTQCLAEIAREADIALMGASCMGFFNFVDSLYLTGYPYHRAPQQGAISFITHSGSTFSAVAKNTRGMNFNYVISPGQELVLSAADYLSFVIDQPETRVVGLFLETIRDPAGFCAALERARAADIPVVLLKIGRSERGASMALAHTGALAGAQATIEAVASRYNVALVRTMEEMLDTLELFASGRRPPMTALASVHDSGGERGMLVDLAVDIGIDFAELSPSTLQILGETLDPGLEPGNPADLWGSGHNWQHIYRTCITAMINDPAVGAFNFGIDFNVGSRLGPDYKAIANEAFHATTKPFAVMSNVAAGTDPAEAAELRAAGIPVLMGAEHGLRAFRHLFRFSQRAAGFVAPTTFETTAFDASLETLLKVGLPMGEFDSLQAMNAFGLPVVSSSRVTHASQLSIAAEQVGYPLVIKTAQPEILHKSDVQGVKTGIGNLEQLSAAYADLNDRLGPTVLLQPQANLESGIELFLGAIQDPQFGPLVTVGFGGVLIELLQDAISFLAPTSPEEVLERLPELRGYGLFAGVRGKTPVDIRSVAHLVADFSRFVATFGDRFLEIDANPVLVTGSASLILDALIVPAARVA